MFMLYLQLVATLHGCSAAICDKVKQSAEGAIQAVVEFVIKRGNELKETDISRFCCFPVFFGCFLLLLFLFTRKKSLFHEFLNNISSLKVVLVSGSSYIMRAETLFVLTQLIRLHDHRTTHSLLSATIHVTEKYLRQETLGAVSFRSKFRPHFDFVVIIIFLLLVVFFVLCINCSVLLQVFSLTIRRYVPWPRTRVRKSYSMKYWLQQKGTLFQRIYLDCEVAGQYRMHST